MDSLPFIDLVEDCTGGNPKVKTSDYLSSGKIPVVDQSANFISGYVDDESLACKVSLPCIVFGDHTRGLKFIDFPFALGADGVKILKPCEKMDPKFLYHYLRSVRLPEDQGYSRHFKFLKRVNIPVISLPEQRRIAAILDKADAIRRKRRQAIDLMSDFLRSVFLEMFGDPIENPKKWPASTFGQEITSMEYGSRFYNEQYSPNGIRIVRITDLGSLGNLDFDEMPTMSVSEDEKRKYVLKSGDLIFARTGATVGKTAVLGDDDPECIAGAYFIRMRFKEEVLPIYAQMVLRSDSVQSVIATRSRQSAQQNFSGPGIRELKLPIPPIDLQRNLLEVVNQVKKAKQRMDSSVIASTDLFASLSSKMFERNLAEKELS